MRKLSRYLLLPLTVGLVFVAACGGGSSSPTAPSSTTTTTKVIALAGPLAFGEVTVGTSRDLTLTISNNGNAVLTLGDTLSISATFGSNVSSTGGSKTIQPNGSTTMSVRFTPSAVGALSGTLTINADHTSGTNTIAISGTGTAAPTPPITLVGAVLDSATRRALGGVRVSALTPSLLTTLATTTTDGNGFYSLVVPSATALTVNYTLTGYNIQNVSSNFSADARRDINLVQSAPAAAALEYRVTGSRASLTYSNCTAGTSQASAANLPWSFTCASVPAGQFVYISAQNTGDSGTITVAIYKRGVLYRESSSTGAFAIATASGSY